MSKTKYMKKRKTGGPKDRLFQTVDKGSNIADVP